MKDKETNSLQGWGSDPIKKVELTEEQEEALNELVAALEEVQESADAVMKANRVLSIKEADPGVSKKINHHKTDVSYVVGTGLGCPICALDGGVAQLTIAFRPGDMEAISELIANGRDTSGILEHIVTLYNDKRVEDNEAGELRIKEDV